MAAMLPFIQLAAGAVSAIGSIRQGNAANAAAQANAQALKQRADAVRSATVGREEMQRAQARQVVGEQVAAGAESGGMLAGSNLDLLRQSMFNAEMDALNIRYQGLTEGTSLENEARLERFRGRQARTAGYLSAVGSILSGGAGYLNAGGKIPTFGRGGFTPGHASTVGMST